MQNKKEQQQGNQVKYVRKPTLHLSDLTEPKLVSLLWVYTVKIFSLKWYPI